MPTKASDPKRKAVLDRIESLEEDILRAKEYLESGKHANWSGFRPLFVNKFKNGKELPPHKDWVENVFLPRKEKALRRAEKLIERISQTV
jgi:hypothetical protein